MNFTSGDVALVASLDYVTVSCRISYFSTRYWIPHPECLPSVIGEREVINTTQRTICFTNAFNVTPDIDGAVVECVVKFNRTAYDPRGIAHDAPLDVLLWISTPLYTVASCIPYIENNSLKLYCEQFSFVTLLVFSWNSNHDYPVV